MFMSCETFTTKWTLSLRQLYKHLTSCYCYVCACRISFRRLVLMLKVPHLWLATWVIWTVCLLIKSVRRFYQVPGDWWKQIYITQWDYRRERIAVTGLHLLPGVFNELPIDSECRWTVFFWVLLISQLIDRWNWASLGRSGKRVWLTIRIFEYVWWQSPLVHSAGQ